jgi:hypothetical protein
MRRDSFVTRLDPKRLNSPSVNAYASRRTVEFNFTPATPAYGSASVSGQACSTCLVLTIA